MDSYCLKDDAMKEGRVTGKRDEDRSMKMMNQRNIAPTACRVSVHAVVVGRGTRVGTLYAEGEMMRFMLDQIQGNHWQKR